jgi:hypothetical protein
METYNEPGRIFASRSRSRVLRVGRRGARWKICLGVIRIRVWVKIIERKKSMTFAPLRACYEYVYNDEGPEQIPNCSL